MIFASRVFIKTLYNAFPIVGVNGKVKLILISLMKGVVGKMLIETERLLLREYTLADCSDIIRQVSCEKGVKLIDLDRTVPKNDDMIYDYVHLTDEGSKVVALEILNKLFETC